MRLIVASNNPGKLTFLEQFFTGTEHILESCGIGLDVEENGADPAENALIKAEACAERLGKPAVALDSGLYFVELPMDDPRQPGLFVRRVNGRELSYEEMVGHYRALARSFGGSAEVRWGQRIPALSCDPAMTAAVAGWLRELSIPGMEVRSGARGNASEDFACIAAQIPSCYLFLTAGFSDKRGAALAHDPRVQFNEDVLPMGAAALAHCTIRWLQQGAS